MIDHMKALLQQGGAAEMHVLDISALPATMHLGFDRAVLFLTPLSPAFILAMQAEGTAQWDEYLHKETAMETLADRLADTLTGRGFGACSLSELSNLDHGYREGGLIDPDLLVGPSPLPLKALARIAGLGFIGKNNLLVTERYGCALAMGAILTDAPLALSAAGPLMAPRCGTCDACVQACPGGALHGRLWHEGTLRETLVDIGKCCCALRCMMTCPYTLLYDYGRWIGRTRL